MRNIFFALVCSLFLTGSILGDYTYLDYDKLVFGNGGGFEAYSTNNVDYYLRVLNLGTDDDYISKTLTLEGNFKSTVPTTANRYYLYDLISLGSTTTYEDDVVPTYEGGTPTDMLSFVGQFENNFMLFNEDTIIGYVEVTPNEYEYAPIYFQEDSGPLYMGKTSTNYPILTFYPQFNGQAYMAINTTNVAEAVTIDGDFQVDGAVIPELITGTLAVYEEDNTLLNSSSPSEVTLATFDSDNGFEFIDYVTTNATVFVTLHLYDNGSSNMGSAWFWFELDYWDGDSWETYDDPIDSSDLNYRVRTEHQFDGNSEMSQDNITMVMSTIITPNDDGTAKEMRLTLKAERDDGQLDVRNIEMYVLGIPGGTFAGTYSEQIVTGDTGIEITSQAFEEIDGNYLTDQFLSFGSGVGIVESGTKLLFVDSEGYADFEAYSVSMNQFFELDMLQIHAIDDNTDDTYPMRVGESDLLGFDSYGSFYSGNIVSHNIQTLTSAIAAKETTLNILADIHVGDDISILTTGIADVNVEIGDVVSDSDVMLNVSGNILVTDAFEGTFAQVGYASRGGYSGMLDGSGVTTYLDSSGEYVELNLDENSTWTIIAFVHVSAQLTDNSVSSAIVVFEDEDGNLTEGTSYPCTMDNDDYQTRPMNAMSLITGVEGGTWKIYAKATAKAMGTDAITGKYDLDGDSSYGNVSYSIKRYGVGVAAIAIPGAQ